MDISDEDLDTMIQTNIYGTVNTLREAVPELVYFLASDASSFCTGGHYLADGGLVAK